MEALGALGILGGGLLTIIFLFIALLMPFFIYGTNNRTKQTAMLLKETNKLLAEIRDRLPAAD